VLLESPQQVRFNQFYFTNFQSHRMENIDFGVDFVAGNSQKFPKIGF
jgi:hypothetical protein